MGLLGTRDLPFGCVADRSATMATERNRPSWVSSRWPTRRWHQRFAKLTWQSMLATVPPVVGMFWASRRRRVDRKGPSTVFTAAQVAPWVVVPALAVGLEIGACPVSRANFPTLSSSVSPFAGDATGWYRFAGYLAWFALRAWLARR